MSHPSGIQWRKFNCINLRKEDELGKQTNKTKYKFELKTKKNDFKICLFIPVFIIFRNSNFI